MAQTASPKGTDAAPPGPPSRRWRFGPAILDERTLELTVNGLTVLVEPKSLAVLQHLLHHAGEVVTKDELLDAVWPGRIITENALVKTVARLREALSDAEQTLIRTVHGFGWRLMAPVEVEAVVGAKPPRFDFKAGEPLHLRPDWRLVECLGRGGHGEVWLARHAETQEPRVFKYAYDIAQLATLKREITLFRFLDDSLGESLRWVRLLRWNLEEPPYFLEEEYVEGGSLVAWAERQGGLQKVPQTLRLDIAAQVAEVLAGAHSVGVLHKDLKPANVLIRIQEDGLPRVVLADFGSGGMLDPQRLEALGITRLGFTKTVGVPETTEGTHHYLAPEVLAGQPATVKADLYSLGVMLYQLVIGDFKKHLAPGWEQEIEDELLKEDIAAAAAGNPVLRMADAAQLALGLRTLEARRIQRQAEQAARVEAEQARVEMGHYRARRPWVRATVGTLLLGLAISSGLAVLAWRAQQRANDAAETTRAVSEFLNRDLLVQADPRQNLNKDSTITEVLDRAAATVDERFKDRPEAAAQVHLTLAEAYFGLTQHQQSRDESAKALGLYEGLGQSATVQGLRARLYLGWGAVFAEGNMQKAIPILDEALRLGRPGLGRLHPQVLEIAAERVQFLVLTPEFDRTEGAIRALLEETGQSRIPEIDRALVVEQRVGWALSSLSDYSEAEQLARHALQVCVRTLGEGRFDDILLRMFHAGLLMDLGRQDEAEQELAKLQPYMQRLIGKESRFFGIYLGTLGALRMQQNRLAEAETYLQQALGINQAIGAQTFAALGDLFRFAQLRQKQKRLGEAETYMRTLLAAAPQKVGTQHWGTVMVQAGLADILREQNRFTEAWDVIRAADTSVLKRQVLPHRAYADLRRVEGLLWQQEKQYGKAREALEDALRIVEARNGAKYWLADQLRKELALLPNSPAASP